MSTRCQIGIYKSNPKTEKAKVENFHALLYRHCDGYPSAILPDIIPFLQWFDKARGISDTEYVTARLLQWICNVGDKEEIDLYKSMGRAISERKFTGTLSYGICKNFHGDIEYFYAIYPSGISVYSTPYQEDFKLIGEFKLDDNINIEETIKICEKSEVK